ncbi:spore germination protein GerPB [Pontibacillus salipaludis]|uniref:Spore germination protein GerPB n=1 Tax=Pontibacillus salipaludis TaxID=1697394 RepID=A0ABQ1Q898_9BACI|nr:spore germination protein GerPB [Pontibacillus salipaludis]GGD17696.1 putative spore germination protein GerPB [Pontibacillus salipaludis]
MNYTIHQSINIHFLKVGSVSNSSVFQIGSAGVIQARSSLYNTGAYTEPAEEAEALGEEGTGEENGGPLVPLSIS